MMKILIADDDARMRQMVKQMVAGLASEVCEARDGGEAITICAAQRPDWVLMDLRMKPMDGLHATAEEADVWLSRLEAGEDAEAPECHR